MLALASETSSHLLVQGAAVASLVRKRAPKSKQATERAHADRGLCASVSQNRHRSDDHFHLDNLGLDATPQTLTNAHPSEVAIVACKSLGTYYLTGQQMSHVFALGARTSPSVKAAPSNYAKTVQVNRQQAEVLVHLKMRIIRPLAALDVVVNNAYAECEAAEEKDKKVKAMLCGN
eukprot:TRINITY_DN74372_c0_g1_i1.p2 TRINITY_DN74372_c0_g1~~TRINITY_DN74372_c0_g1_i1.p2  ORF type:complete len:193 (-),score=13.04 TRINITY_DN74372_c0_g1_i1:174-701(-)